MPTRKTVTLHAVQRRGWICYDDVYLLPSPGDEDWCEVADPYPLCCFLSREKAQAHCRDLERKDRHQVDTPFQWGGDGTDLADHSTLPFDEFCARLQALGLPRPTSRRRSSYVLQNLSEWWEQNGGQLTPEQFDAIWGMLDRVRFFEVAEVKVPLASGSRGRAAAADSTPLYLVEKRVEQQDWSGRHKYLGEEAEPLRAFLDAAAAEDDCRQREEDAWKKINPFTYGTKLTEWTSLDSGRLRDWMLDIGLEPPAGKFNAGQWRKWFDQVRPTLTPAQMFQLREGMDRIRFFRVACVTE